MKKLSLFLSALFISMMSFAGEATISFADVANRTVWNDDQQVWEQNGIVVTNDKAASTQTIKDYSNPARFYAKTALTIKCKAGNITKIVINTSATTYATNCVTCFGADVATADGLVVTVTPKEASDTYTIANMEKQVRMNSMTITYEATNPNYVAPAIIEGVADFADATEVTIVTEEGLKAYYTLDGTEPTTASTEYTAPFELTATTTVKAIAHNATTNISSEVVQKTFKQAIKATCAEAAAIALALEKGKDNATADKYVVEGYISEFIENGYNDQNGTQRFWMADTKDGGKVLMPYYYAVDSVLPAGTRVQVIGNLYKYNTGQEDQAQIYNGTLTVLPEKVEPTTETVYFVNAQKWAKVNIYTWDPQIQAWPGVAMNKEAEQLAGYDVYSYTVDAGTTFGGMLFTNANGTQTADLKWESGKYFVKDAWYTKEQAEAKLNEPVADVWSVMGVAGLGLNWTISDATNDMKLQEDGSRVLVKENLTLAAGNYEYKVAKNHSWDVSIPQGNTNQKLTIATAGIYNITFTLNAACDKLTAEATLVQAAVIIPSIAIAGEMNGWSMTASTFALAADSLTASIKLNLQAKSYGFKMIVGGNWTSDGKTITRDANSTKFTGANGGDGKLVADMAGEYTLTWTFATNTLTVKYPAKPVAMVGVVKRAIQMGESVVVLTHEADGTPHIYNVVAGEAYEVSQEGVIARDPENAGDLLAISDIAATEDGKLVAVNQMICQDDADHIDEGYKQGENRFYIWNSLNENPTVWFKSNQYANWFRSSNGYTMAIKGTSTDATIALSGYHATKSWARIANYKVIAGVYTEPANSADGNEHYTWCEGTAAGDIDDNVIGKNYELNASPLAVENWIVDGDLANPIEYTTPAEIQTVLTSVTPISVDLGKKFNGATYVTVGERHIMVAPYADAEGKLAGVKVVEITNGLDAATELAAVNLEAAVEATAAATAVAVAEDVLTITVVADAALHTLTYTLAPAIEWIEMELAIANLTTETLTVEGMGTFLQMMGRDEMNDADVQLFLNDYTGEDKEYVVNAENSLMTFGGMELKVIEGTMTKATDAEKGDVFTGVVYASVEEEGMTMYVKFALSMYAQPAIDIEIENAEIVLDEASAILLFKSSVELEGTTYPLTLEVSGFEATEFKEYAETYLTIGDDANWYDYAAGPAAVFVEGEAISLEGEFTSFATGKKFNVAIAGTLPKKEQPEPTYTENKLNTFAFGLESELVDGTLNVTYRLNNSNATSVDVVVYNAGEAVATVPGTTTIGKNTVAVATADLPKGVELTWSVVVKGTSVAAPTQEEKTYSFYHPSSVDIDNNPENFTFGLILTNEGMHSVKDIAGYASTGFGAGIYAFTPSFDLMPNGDQPGYNGGVEFTNGRADNSAKTAYSPRRLRISEDGRIFVTSLNTDGNYLWEVNAEDLNEWNPVFQGAKLNEQAELLDADSNFIAGPNAGFDVKGAGENLQLMMYSANIGAIDSYVMGGFRLHEYNLGTATTWTTAPSKAWVEGLYAINYAGTQVAYDNEGGVWIASYRGTASDVNPGLVHINKDGVEDAKLLWNNVRQAGIRFNHDFTKLIVAGNNGTAKKATIYAVSKDANGAPVLTEETVIDMKVLGNNLNDFAWDYAGNLYGVGNSNEKIVAWAMPYSGEVATPAATRYAFQLEGQSAEVYEDEITNVTFDMENMAFVGGPSTNFQIEVALYLGQDNLDGSWSLADNSTISVMGTPATFKSGYVKDIDIYAPAANAVITAEWNGALYEFHIAMSAAQAAATVVVVENANVEVIETEIFEGTFEYSLKMTGTWADADGVVYPVLVEVPVYYPEATEASEILSTVTVGGWGDNDPWLGFGEGTLTVTTVDKVVTAKGIVVNPGTGIAIDITISGKIIESALGEIITTTAPVKVIKNGQLFIIKDGVQYNVQGAVVK